MQGERETGPRRVGRVAQNAELAIVLESEDEILDLAHLRAREKKKRRPDFRFLVDLRQRASPAGEPRA